MTYYTFILRYDEGILELDVSCILDRLSCPCRAKVASPGSRHFYRRRTRCLTSLHLHYTTEALTDPI